MDYPKTVTIEDPKIKKLLEEKSELIKQGIAESQKIEELEKQMDDIDKKIQEVEKTVDISDLNKEAQTVTRKVEAAIKEMDVLKKQIYERMREAAPKELYEEYDRLVKEKGKTEEQRNKYALKAQKYNDKIIPLGRKLMEKYLTNEYDDYDSIKLEDGEVKVSVFNHLNDFKVKYNKK